MGGAIGCKGGGNGGGNIALHGGQGIFSKIINHHLKSL
jgi:hypothetical protein